MKGIYLLEGDTLKIWVDESNKGRPKELVAKEGSGHVVAVFKREKP